MRIAHIADTHLGYRSNTIPHRDVDFATSWKQACLDIVDAHPDLIIHAGDVFHRPNPSWGALRDFLDGSEILEKAGCPILGISGNHDSSRLTTKHNVFSVLSKAAPYFHISYEDKPWEIHLPSMHTEVLLLSHQALLSKTLCQDFEKAWDNLWDARNYILVAHGDIRNLEASQEQGSVVIPDFVFDYPWSYVALGHLHAAQPFGETGWYSGSIERCGWSDYPAEPAWTLVTISDGVVRHEQRPLPHMPMIQLPDVDAMLEDDIPEAILRSVNSISIPEGRTVARVRVMGLRLFARRSIQFMVSRLIRERYPKLTVQVSVDSSLWDRVDPGDAPQGQEMQSIEDMFREFVGSKTFEDESLSDLLLDTGLSAIAKAREAEGLRDTL